MPIKDGGPPPKPKRRESATYHTAAFSAFGHHLRKYQKNGDITLVNEHHLSKHPPRIDVIIKKNRAVEIDTVWGRIFRGHNIIEYKSPAAPPLSLSVFDKVVHGYVGLYASQEKVPLTDMTATIVCFRKPEKLFKILENEFRYRVLKKDAGVYYIVDDSRAADKALAVQIVVSPELPDSEFFLKQLRRGIDSDTAKKALELHPADEESQAVLAPWYFLMFQLNEEQLNKEDADMKKKADMEKMVKGWISNGLLADELREARQEGRQEGEQRGVLKGIQKGMQKGKQEGMTRLLEYLKKGHSLEEAKKKFALR
jgi:hypothetical protein